MKDLIEQLEIIADNIGEEGTIHSAINALEAQTKRIAELQALLSHTSECYAECIATREDYRFRIAQLEAVLNDCIKIADEHKGCKISHVEGVPCEAGEQIADKIREKING